MREKKILSGCFWKLQKKNVLSHSTGNLCSYVKHRDKEEQCRTENPQFRSYLLDMWPKTSHNSLFLNEVRINLECCYG